MFFVTSLVQYNKPNSYQMNKFVTVTCCALLTAYGAYIGSIGDATIGNEIHAEPISLSNLCSIKEVHDTVTIHGDTIRDTVHIPKYKTKYKIKRIPCTTCDSVSSTGHNIRGDRKEFTPDTLPTKLYRIRGTIEPVESETRQ